MPHLTSIEMIGLEKGRQEGQTRIVRRQLERRWGSLSATTEQALRALSSEQLESLAEALLDFNSLADLETWLKSHQQAA